MKPRVYIETTIVSYLTSRPAHDVLLRGRQLLTREWWDRRHADFRLVASSLVILEAGRGDAGAAKTRLDVVQALDLLELDDRARVLAHTLVSPGAIPAKAADDALHIALCAVHAVPYLLTWNFRHIANAEIRLKLGYLCASSGYQLPVICTPEEL